MPKTTLRANARTVPADRRGFLRSAIAAVALAAPAAAMASASVDDEVLPLWTRRRDLMRAEKTASAAMHEAEGRMPAWARIGPRQLGIDGLFGADVGWPAIEEIASVPKGMNFVIVRPSPVDLRKHYDLKKMFWPEMALRDYRRGLRALVFRLRAKMAAERESGYAAASDQRRRLGDERDQIEASILGMEPTSANVVAAQFMIEMACVTLSARPVDEAFDNASLFYAALRFALPGTSGLIRQHVEQVIILRDRSANESEAFDGV